VEADFGGRTEMMVVFERQGVNSTVSGIHACSQRTGFLHRLHGNNAVRSLWCSESGSWIAVEKKLEKDYPSFWSSTPFFVYGDE